MAGILVFVDGLFGNMGLMEVCFKSSSSNPSPAISNDILNMIENLPLEIKDQIKTLTLQAKAKRIIRVLHNYLRNHQPHFLVVFPDIDQP